MNVIDEIKARVDIVDIVSQSVQLRRTGKNYIGFCPFHPNTRTPSFVVFPETGTWHCFGQCNEGGDIFSFTMKKEGWDFSETLQYLADLAGVELKPQTEEEKAAVEEYEGLRNLLEEAVNFYRHNLVNTENGKAALEYLHKKRGLNDQTIEAFGLGYAPNAWDATILFFTKKGYTEKQLMTVGLITERESGGFYDRFRNRIMFPIRDARGRICGFGARKLNPDDVPKFINSPQTPLFDKSSILYGLDRARKAIRKEDRVVIVEGYLDVIALHQSGFINTVSPMGTALTEQHLRMLKKYSKRIVLALDPDAAGEKATLRGLDVARNVLDKENDLVFDARGYLRQESRLKADIRVSILPDELDPDEVVARDPDEWKEIIENARPIVVHVMETLAAEKNVDDPKVKTEIAVQLLPLIEDVSSPIERDTYRQQLARLLHVDERTLVTMTPKRRKTVLRKPTAVTQAKSQEREPVLSSVLSSYRLETFCLGVLLRYPEWMYKIDRHLQDSGLSRLGVADFQHTDYKEMIKLLKDALDQDVIEPSEYVQKTMSDQMMEIADNLYDQTKKLDPNEGRIFEDLMRGLLVLRRKRLHQEIEYIQILLEDSQENGEKISNQQLLKMREHTKAKKLLDQAIQNYTNRAIRQIK